MITSKQRSQLKSIVQNEDTIIMIGKGGINDTVISSVKDALKAREIVKGRVLENSMVTPREACEALAVACGAEPVQVIGSKFVLYKRNNENPKIQLVR